MSGSATQLLGLRVDPTFAVGSVVVAVGVVAIVLFLLPGTTSLLG